MRIGIRLKLLFLSSFLFAIPYLGYQYMQEVEKYLQQGQEQTMLGTARAVATALHERPTLFDNQAAYLADVRPGTDLYAHKIIDPVRLDGELSDWLDYRHLALEYAEQSLLDANQDYDPQSLRFEHMVGQFSRFLYAMFEVTDEQVLFRPQNSLRVDRNDHLQIAITSPEGAFQRYIVAPMQEGWVSAFLLEDNPDSLRAAKPETRIQGQWRNTLRGYNIELRFPLAMLGSQIAFAIVDVDNPTSREKTYVVGTANPNQFDALGTVLVPSNEIENIIRGLKYSNSRVWVVDKHMRVLARSGSIQRATGIDTELPEEAPVRGSWWDQFEQRVLFPLYYQFLIKPPADFIDELQDAYALEGRDIAQALNGNQSSLWRLSPDNKAVILSAAHPIYIEGQVMGAVVVEQTTHGIRTLKNKAMEQLFHVILAVMILGTLALFLFASRISFRIRKLRNETEKAIDHQGKIIGSIKVSRVQDEIGDLSRTFSNVLGKLNQYNSYLENMASRLSHELRTPVAIVNSSLENMVMEDAKVGDNAYMQRAQNGIKRLSKILSNLSEATRLEQAIQNNEQERFELRELVAGCVEGYKIAYPHRQFSLLASDIQKTMLGSPELFAQMLDKIISNAVEFSPSDTVVELSLDAIHKDTRLQVSNQGTLLPDNMQDELLDSMVSIRQEADTEQVHLGLGLYIAKLIATYHRGRLSIANRLDKQGVVVTFEFA